MIKWSNEITTILSKLITYGSLFPGISEFDLKAKQLGMQVKFLIEHRLSYQKILKKNFPDAVIINDIRDIYRYTHEMTDVYNDGEVMWCERHDLEFADCDCIGCSEWDDEIGGIDILYVGKIGKEEKRVIEELRPLHIITSKDGVKKLQILVGNLHVKKPTRY